MILNLGNKDMSDYESTFINGFINIKENLIVGSTHEHPISKKMNFKFPIYEIHLSNVSLSCSNSQNLMC